MNILVSAAHPDDEVLGCGGALARFSSEGAQVSILILASGLTSRLGFDKSREAELLGVHRERACKASRLLGAAEVNFCGFPDQKMDMLPLLDVTQAVEAEIRRVKPEIVFTHHGGDLNLDHTVAFRATMTATRPMAGACVKKLYAYEIPSSTEWAFRRFSPEFRPNVFFDIDQFLEKKIEAMQIYESEAREFPHPRSPDALRALAHRWGSCVGLLAVEAFECIWELA